MLGLVRSVAVGAGVGEVEVGAIGIVGGCGCGRGCCGRGILCGGGGRVSAVLEGQADIDQSAESLGGLFMLGMVKEVALTRLVRW